MEMNRERGFSPYYLSVFLFFICATIVGGSISTAKAETTTLRFATYQPPRGIEGEAPKWLMDEITKRTNGSVKFQEYFGGSLLKARELLKGVQMGSTDLGFIFTAYYPKELKVHQLPQVFIRGPVEPERKMEFVNTFYKEIPEALQEIESWNQQIIGIHLFGKMAVGGVIPIKELGQVDGVKMRAAGGSDALHMKCLGANVVFMRSSDVYSAFQKKAIQAAYSTPASFYRSKWYETAKPFYLLVIPKFSGVYALITINKDKFKSLPAETQNIILQVGRDYNKYEADLLKRMEQEYTEDMVSKGLIVSEASKGSITRWADNCEAEAKAKGISDAEKQGLPGKEIMERLTTLIKEYSD